MPQRKDVPNVIDFEEGLNERQVDAVKTIEGPLLIIAGAGSGKTRVITYRIAYMLDRGVPQSNILALTFTNKAAREMSSRVKELTGRKLQMLTVSTFHAFGVQVLRNDIDKLGWRENFSIYDEVDRNQLIKETGRELGFTSDAMDIPVIGRLFSDVKTGRVEWRNANDQYQKLYEEYNHSLKVYNAVDFDDLIVKPIELWRAFPEVREKYRERYRYIMIDEFQDTSRNQYDMMHLLADRNVCVVGDDDQSIYSWRGANYENIINFEKDFPGLKEIKLEQNYRSTTTILEAANGVILNNTNRKEKALWTGSSGGNAIEVYYPENEVAEAEFIAETVRAVKLRDNLRYSDFGVLIRTNNLTDRLEEAFLAEGLPYRVSGGTSFFQRKEVKDVISYLRLIANVDDDVNFIRIVNCPRRGIGKKTLEELTLVAGRNNCSLYGAINAVRYGNELAFPEKMKEDLFVFSDLIEKYRGEILGRRNLAAKVRALVDEIDYWGYLLTEHQKNEKAARWKLHNIDIFVNMIDTWEKDPDNLDPSIYNYLNRISLVTRDDMEDEEDSGKVNLMTIHASKGLEFEIVFIAGCEDGIIPHAKSVEENPENIEEERRLFYVAITRAKRKLFISSCQRRRKLRDTVECSPSPFLEEIPQHLLIVHEPEVAADAEEASKYFEQMKKKFTM